ncbi:MAG TPA: hypothetical protein VNG33_19185 [Polyangiaceae bacterium]|nr:hypothetical protein [Polyangiaceae bacterium]
MIRIVGYLIPDASMPTERLARWFTIWESPPNLSSSAALKRAAQRMATWEQRLKLGSYNGVKRVALEACGPCSFLPGPGEVSQGDTITSVLVLIIEAP